MNKFELINVVTTSDLPTLDKPLLIELIMRSDNDGLSWPSVERLCKARGIKHEKNFKGADHYLPGLVTKTKKGRKNSYMLNAEAILALAESEVTIKHTDTPAVEGVYTPAVEGVSQVNTPATADNTPAVEGANSTYNNTPTTDSTSDTSKSASAPVDSSLKEDIPNSILSQSPSFEEIVTPLLKEPSFSLTQTGASREKHYRVKEKELAHARQRMVLEDMYEDPDATW